MRCPWGYRPADPDARSRERGVVGRFAEIVSAPRQSAPPAVPDGGDSVCLIATVAHGTELAPQVQALREYGDGTLLATGLDSAFMSAFSGAYYSFSPHVADLESEYPAFWQAVAAAIAPMLHAFQVAALAAPLGGVRRVAWYCGPAAHHGLVRRRSRDRGGRGSRGPARASGCGGAA